MVALLACRFLEGGQGGPGGGWRADGKGERRRLRGGGPGAERPGDLADQPGMSDPPSMSSVVSHSTTSGALRVLQQGDLLGGADLMPVQSESGRKKRARKAGQPPKKLGFVTALALVVQHGRQLAEGSGQDGAVALPPLRPHRPHRAGLRHAHHPRRAPAAVLVPQLPQGAPAAAQGPCRTSPGDAVKATLAETPTRSPRSPGAPTPAPPSPATACSSPSTSSRAAGAAPPECPSRPRAADQRPEPPPAEMTVPSAGLIPHLAEEGSSTMAVRSDTVGIKNRRHGGDDAVKHGPQPSKGRPTPFRDELPLLRRERLMAGRVWASLGAPPAEDSPRRGPRTRAKEAPQPDAHQAQRRVSRATQQIRNAHDSRTMLRANERRAVLLGVRTGRHPLPVAAVVR